MRTLVQGGILISAVGLTLGLAAGPAAAAPAGSMAPSSAGTSAMAQQSPDVSILGRAYFKNAKNVSGGPGKKVTCTFVYRNGGRQTLGRVCFQAKGDKFWVQDRRADGMHIVMRAMYTGNTQTQFDCRDYKGKAAGWTACNFSKQMKEKRSINFAALAYKGNKLKHTGITASAKS